MHLAYRSLIRPPKPVEDRLKILSPQKPEQLKQKPQAPIGQAGEQNDQLLYATHIHI